MFFLVDIWWIFLLISDVLLYHLSLLLVAETIELLHLVELLLELWAHALLV